MIELSEDERRKVEAFIRRGKANARNITRAHILLKSGERWRIARIAETFDWRFTTTHACAKLARPYP